MMDSGWHRMILCDDGEEMDITRCALKYGVSRSTITYWLDKSVTERPVKHLYYFKYVDIYIVKDKKTKEEIYRGSVTEVAKEFSVEPATVYGSFLNHRATFCGMYYLEKAKEKRMERDDT